MSDHVVHNCTSILVLAKLKKGVDQIILRMQLVVDRLVRFGGQVVARPENLEIFKWYSRYT